MLKPKILFVLDSLRIGGAEKSLITLLSLLDYSKYDVDLQLFAFDGAFMQSLPQEVNVLPPTSWTSFTQKSLCGQLMTGHLGKLWTRLKLAIGIRQRTFNGRELDYFVWQQTKHQYEKSNIVYDVAIGYGHYLPSFYVLEKVDAKQKVTYLNTPFNPPKSLIEMNRQVYNGFDKIIAISQDVNNSFVAYYPEFAEKTITINDPFSVTYVEKCAAAFQPEWATENVPHLVTAARLEQNAKGMDILLDTARMLKERGLTFKWFVFGEGSYREQMAAYVTQHHLQDHLILPGPVPNPYPYVKHATLYVQTSRFEGFGNSIAEARMLNTPVVTTAYRGWEMQMKPGKNGMVAEINAESVADAIAHLLLHPEEIETIREYLKTEVKGNPEELEKFNKIVLEEGA